MENICCSQSFLIEMCSLVLIFQKGKVLSNGVLHSQALISLDVLMGLCNAEYICLDSVCFQIPNNSLISGSTGVCVAVTPCLQ